MRKYATFTGRARRSELWWFVLAYTLILFPFMIAFMLSFFPAAEDLFDLLEQDKNPPWRLIRDSVEWEQLVGPGLLFGGVWLLFFVPMLAVMVRRLHDIGLSGWWILVGLIPLGIGTAALIVMGVIDGQANENEWGPDPKADERPVWEHAPGAPPPQAG